MSTQPHDLRPTKHAFGWLLLASSLVMAGCPSEVIVITDDATTTATGGSNTGGGGGGSQVDPSQVHAACQSFLDAMDSNPQPSICVSEANSACEDEAIAVTTTAAPCGGANACVSENCRCEADECGSDACHCVVTCLQAHGAPELCYQHMAKYYQCLADYCASWGG